MSCITYYSYMWVSATSAVGCCLRSHSDARCRLPGNFNLGQEGMIMLPTIVPDGVHV